MNLLNRKWTCRAISLFLPGAFFLLEANSSFAQTHSWIWAKGSTGKVTGVDYGTGVATDKYGHAYVTGYFFNQAISFGTVTLNTTGGYELFLVKYAPDGDVLWAKNFGGDGHEAGLSVATDTTGNIYVAGHFTSSLTIGSTNLVHAGEKDVLVIKCDPDGNVLWANSAGGTGDEAGLGIATDLNGNVYVTGSFQSSVISFGDTALTNAGGTDIFMTKYDTDGNLLWAKKAGGASNDVANAIATDPFGNVFVTGHFESAEVDFESIILINTGESDIFIAKYNTDGHALWAKQASGTDSEFGFGVATDEQGNAYVAGDFMSDTVYWEDIALHNTGYHSPFVVKYNLNGHVEWASSAIGTGGENRAFSISSDAEGNVCITGAFSGSVLTFGGDTLINDGSLGNIFVAKYNTLGQVLWAKKAGGAKMDIGYGVAQDGNGNAYVTGTFNSTASVFDETTLSKPGPSGFNVFVAKVGEVPLAITENASLNTVKIYPNPSTGKFIIKSSPVKINKMVVSNLLGLPVYTSEAVGSDFEIDLSGQPDGIYLLKLQTEKGNSTERLVVRRR